MTDLSHPDTTWNDGLARVIKKEGEQAQAFYVMYYRASIWAKRRNDCLQIPQIIISLVCGFFSATSDLVPALAIGALSITVGIFGAINNYYKFSQRSENYKMAASLYLKLYKHIEIELSLPEKERIDPDTLLPDMRDRMNRIGEVADVLPQSIIDDFKKQFHDGGTSMPILANGLNKIEINMDKPQPLVIDNTPRMVRLNDTPKPKIGLVVE